MPQYWLKFGGGAGKVSRYVAWTSLYDGTTVYAVDKVRDLGAALGFDQAIIDAVAGVCGSCPSSSRARRCSASWLPVGRRLRASRTRR